MNYRYTVTNIGGADVATELPRRLRGRENLYADEIFKAIGNNDLVGVQNTIAICPALVNVKDRDKENQFPLYAAAQQGNIEIIRLLIQEHAKADDTTSFQQTAAFAAANEGHLETLQYLLQHVGLNVNHQNIGEDTLIDTVLSSICEIAPKTVTKDYLPMANKVSRLCQTALYLLNRELHPTGTFISLLASTLDASVEFSEKEWFQSCRELLDEIGMRTILNAKEAKEEDSSEEEEDDQSFDDDHDQGNSNAMMENVALNANGRENATLLNNSHDSDAFLKESSMQACNELVDYDTGALALWNINRLENSQRRERSPTSAAVIGRAAKRSNSQHVERYKSRCTDEIGTDRISGSHSVPKKLHLNDSNAVEMKNLSPKNLFSTLHSISTTENCTETDIENVTEESKQVD